MAGFDEQLHGYRQGHQLLSSTIRLAKADQDLIDRLSDVAGPLSPGERFAPYLTLYPLPSETHYVVARTWQDFEAPRAGCVRTRSLLVPMAQWQTMQDLASIVHIVTKAGADQPADRRMLTGIASSLPPVEPLLGTELIEALFLEERGPIVVFDAANPEPLALRLMTALWPGLRRTFSMSTFARSPRTIGRRSFDLVFASKESRSRFSDWTGRRIDGKKRGEARHPWSAPIVENVLSAPIPSLKSLDLLGEMASDGAGSESALRVSLLWDDLRRKLPNSPTAALGMLDIVNTRKARQIDLIRDLEPALIRSAAMAASTMQVVDAWGYLSTLIQKLKYPSMPVVKSIQAVAVNLASRHPRDTLQVISSLNAEPQNGVLVNAIADGLSQSLDFDLAEQLSRLESKNLLDLLFASVPLAKGGIGRFSAISTALAVALRTASDSVHVEARERLLTFLVDDFHVEPARLLLSSLDADGLIKQVLHVHAVNGLSSADMRRILAERSQELHSDAVLRDAVLGLGPTPGGDAFVEATLCQTSTDMSWLLTSTKLSQKRRVELVRSLLMNANLQQLRDMLADSSILTKTIDVLNVLDESDAELLSRIARNVTMPDLEYVTLVVSLLPTMRTRIDKELISRAIECALQLEPNEILPSTLDRLLMVVGEELNGSRVLQAGLQRGVSAAAASRNILGFSRAPDPAHKAILMNVEEMAGALIERRQLDITIEAAEAVAKLLWESRLVAGNGFLRAATTLLPVVLEERRKVASPLIAVIFPPVYRKLAKESVFDFMNLMFIFLELDKCKSARRRLIDAFIHSEWQISDIAIAAVRAGDPVRILGRVARERGGEQVLQNLISDIQQVPEELRDSVLDTLKELEII